MPSRLRVYDVRNSEIPQALGLCATDLASLCRSLNTALPRLLQAGSETGWWGTFAEMRFNVSRAQPYITCPREVARLIDADLCDRPISIQNQFYEFLEFGAGYQPGTCPTRTCRLFSQAFSRNNAVTFVDLVPGNKIIRVYPTDARDEVSRTLIQGLDSNDNPILSQDGTVQVTGVFVELVGPFQDAPMQLNLVTGIQKDRTYGQVKYYSVDTVTGEQVLLLTMEPGETVACYRRYFLNPLPTSCCEVPGATAGTVQVRAMAKLDFVPVAVDTDYTLINNLAAIRCELESVRYEGMDNPNAEKLSIERHARAIRFLNKELEHYTGRQHPAIQFSPFGSAHLPKYGIGQLI